MSERYYYSVPTKQVDPGDGSDPWTEPDIVSNSWQAQYFADGSCLVRTAQPLDGYQELTTEEVVTVCESHGVDPQMVLSWT